MRHNCAAARRGARGMRRCGVLRQRAECRRWVQLSGRPAHRCSLGAQSRAATPAASYARSRARDARQAHAQGAPARGPRLAAALTRTLRESAARQQRSARRTS